MLWIILVLIKALSLRLLANFNKNADRLNHSNCPGMELISTLGHSKPNIIYSSDEAFIKQALKTMDYCNCFIT